MTSPGLNAAVMNAPVHFLLSCVSSEKKNKKKTRFSHCPASFLFFYICSQKTLTQNQFNLFPKCLHLQANSFETFIITLPLGSLVTAFYWGSPALSLFSYLCYHPRYTGTARSVSIWTTTHVFFCSFALFCKSSHQYGIKVQTFKAFFFFLSCIKCVEISTFFFPEITRW